METALDARHPLRREGALPDAREADDEDAAGSRVLEERLEAIDLASPPAEVDRGRRVPDIVHLPGPVASLPVEEFAEVEPAPLDARHEVRELRPAGEEEGHLVQASLRLAALEVDDRDPLLLDLPSEVLGPAEPRLREEVREPPPGFPRDVDLRGFREPARPRPSHRAGHVGPAGGPGPRDSFLGPPPCGPVVPAG